MYCRCQLVMFFVLFSLRVATGDQIELDAADSRPAIGNEATNSETNIEAKNATATEPAGDEALPAPPAESQPEGSDSRPILELEGDPIQRGPIHEAFAEPVQLTLKPTKVIEKSPPEAVEEVPPETQPDEKNVEWISGYWAWDEHRDDYVWVSGVWRKIPHGREWVPGRWEKVADGYQWVPGVWLKVVDDGEVAQQEVLRTPPESLEEGPTSDAPSDEHFWVPGVWQQNETGGYAWRPGFWSLSYDNWVWVPDHYVWTPGGCRFVTGYWDYPWERRGVLYAPCYFGNSYLSHRILYRPTRLIDTNQWLLNLWVGPSYCHYYYGDYYGYTGLGFSPWYRYYGRNRGFYDPFYSYYRLRFPRSYGFGLYSYLDGVHNYYSRHSANRPGVKFATYQGGRRGGRGKPNLYGNVGDLHGRLGNDFRQRDHRHDDVFTSRQPRRGGGGRDGALDGRDVVRGGRDRALDGRNFVRDQSPQQRGAERRLLGYANGQAQYSGQRTRGGITRAQIGTANAPGVKRSEMGVRRAGSRGQGNSAASRGSRNANSTEGQARNNRGSNPRQRPIVTARPEITTRPNSATLSNPPRNRSTGTRRDRGEAPRIQQRAPSVSRPRSSTQVTRRQSEARPVPRVSQPPATRAPRSTPRVTRSSPRASGPAPRISRPTSRPAPKVSRPAPSPARRSSVRPAPRVSRPTPRASRPAPKVSRPAPSPARRSSAGFSTHGMKKARGANLARQRAAMMKRMNQKKGK